MGTGKLRKKASYILLAFLAIVIGLYPLQVINLPDGEGLLSGKPAELLLSPGYLPSFYVHIFAGGIAMLTGFTQFFPKLRRRRIGLHRSLGKVYVLAAIMSGTSGLFISIFASGGITAATGFALLAIAWLYTTLRAYSSIRRKNVVKHREWMIRSYALCFAAVTLRIYLPLSTFVMGIDFITAYRLIAWLCWIPNLLFAEMLILRASHNVKGDTYLG